MSFRDRLVFAGLVGFWLAALAQFWVWWLQPEHNIGLARFILNTMLIVWTTLVPAYFVLMVSRARVANPRLAVPAGWRVAMVVTKAPSEPAAVVQNTLLAMVAQRYPHDTWLADEDPTPEMMDWCARHGVRVSTRRGIAQYHRSTWPRRTKCKEGNLAYFYDTFGYDNYEFVVQLDADHVPAGGYLEAMLQPFLDSEVGYVSAPSQCDANAGRSWSARGRLQVEAPLHGALQAGYNAGLAPLCIGSHYAVRTRALRTIGGLGPELAEDHSTTLLMNAGGWRGVHALYAHAHGDGPDTFSDMLLQEFQWSRSLMTILLRHTPNYIGRLPWRLRLQFLFAQLWYTLFSLTMLAAVLLPIAALLSGKAWVGIAYPEFFVRMAIVTAAVLAIIHWVRYRGWCRPYSRVIAWEGLLFLFARWPWNLMGMAVAVFDQITGRTSEFKVTPKGNELAAPLPFRPIGIYLSLSAVSGLTATVVWSAESAKGFYALAILNALVYLGVAVIAIGLHRIEQGDRVKAGGNPVRMKVAALCGVFALFLLSATLRLPVGVDGLLWGINLSGAAPPVISEMVRGHDTIQLGVYDWNGTFGDEDYVAIEHEFVSWLDETSGRLKELALDATQRNRWPMVTVEPWSDGREGARSLLKAINGGRYDEEIARVCTALAGMDMPVFVRWGHEMEVPTGRYPWANADGNGFIAAYHRFVDACRAEGKEFYYVWSPRGDGPHHKYYPGADYVDHVGLSLYSYAAYEFDIFGRVRSFEENLAERYDRASSYGKAIMIAELGVDGASAHRRQWLAEGLAEVDRFPLLASIVYFNAPDTPGAWGENWSVPDWSIDPRVFTSEADWTPSDSAEID